ncbi:MAG: hypothetical protein ABIQ55_00630 [Gemmatimonadaceae bacterium]
MLSAPHNMDAAEGIAWFRVLGFDVKIVAYLRRQDEWLDSFYRERLKWTLGDFLETRSIEEFWPEEGDLWLDYKQRIGVWIAAVDPENAIVRSYRDVQERDGFRARYCSGPARRSIRMLTTWCAA